MSMQEKARRREATILEHIDDMVSVVDNQYIYRAASLGYARFFGREISDIVGKPVWEIHGTDVFENSIKAGLDKTLAGEQARLQFWRPNHKGEMRCIDSKHDIYIGALTEGPGVAVVGRDITETVLAQQALKKEQALLNTIINAVSDFIFIKDSQGVYQRCNKSFENFLDIPGDEIIGKTDHQLMSPASANYILERDRAVKQSRQGIRNDEWVTYKDGRRRLLDMYKLPLPAEDENEPGLLGIGRNVTFEREAEDNLLLSTLVFDATPDPCLILDHDGKIISANAAAQMQFSELNSASGNLKLGDLLQFTSSAGPALDQLEFSQNNWCGELCDLQGNYHFATLSYLQTQGETEDKYVLFIRDEATQLKISKTLKLQAYQDSLTGLPNRRMLFSRLNSAIARAERQQHLLAVLYIDLNKFKPINDEHGHFVGDEVLVEVAQRLQSCFRATDTLARLGGDEFVALLDISKPQQAARVAEKVCENLDQPLQIKGLEERSVSASIGIALFPEDAGSAEELLQKADQAMYQAKRDSDKRYCFFSSCISASTGS